VVHLLDTGVSPRREAHETWQKIHYPLKCETEIEWFQVLIVEEVQVFVVESLNKDAARLKQGQSPNVSGGKRTFVAQ
jgi:hypothetical protein